MGLINLAISKQNIAIPVQESKKKNSLLRSVAQLSSYDQVLDKFLSTLTAAHADKGFFLFPVENRLSVVIQYGLDMTTCVRMTPEQSFLTEICLKKGWNIFSGSKLDTFTSFFSTHERTSLVTIAVYPLTVCDETGYLVFLQSQLSIERKELETDSILDTINDFTLTLNKNIFILSALSIRKNPTVNLLADRNKMHAAFEEKRYASLFTISFARLFLNLEKIESDFDSCTLYRSMVNKIIAQAGPASILRKNKDYSLRMIIFTATETDYDLYIHQMKKSLEKLFSLTRIGKIDIEYDGVTRTIDTAIDFLGGE